jgi:Domain of unknown function (DUF5664)
MQAGELNMRKTKAETAKAGRKDDAGKPRWDLLPDAAMASVVDVLTFGAGKYEPWGWKKVDQPFWRYLRAALGHVMAYKRGERFDRESGLPHLAHAVCCCLFLLELEAMAADPREDA